MSIELLKNEILRFLSITEPEILCISGKWGVGKTYSWKQFLKDAQKKNDIALDRYAYVSLFGISSLDDLKHAIFENTVPKDKIEAGANCETFQLMLESPEVLGRKSAYWLIKLANNIPYLKYLNFGGAHRVFSLFVRNQIICIDDLDRKGKNLEVSDVLGLINFLKEERNCKIALILNEDALYGAITEESKKKEFRKYFEKVIDISLNFNPTAEESVQIALQGIAKENSLLSEQCIKLNISNIRIIRKIERLVREVAPMLKHFDEQVLWQAISSLTLLGWSVYETEMAPPVDYLKKKNRYCDLLRDKPISEKEGAWNALLDSYGFREMDEFDNTLLEGVNTGFFDPKLVKETALKIEEQIKAKKSAESFWQAWGTYHESFDNNQEEVVDTIYQSFFENVQYLSPNDLNGTVRLFKELGEPAKAAEIIKYYIENRRGDRRFFDLDYHQGIFDINDPDVITEFKHKCESLKDDQDQTAVIIKMAVNRAWSNEDIVMASKLSVDDYYGIFKSRKGDELRSIIDFCLQSDKTTNPSPEMVEISNRAKEALIRIGRESPINARRVRKYVNVDNPTSTE